MPLLILTYHLQHGLIAHVMRTGRSTDWIIIPLIAPAGIGASAYFIVELLPELMSNHRARRAVHGVAALSQGATRVAQ
jgi:hypothetical protein